MTPKRVSDVVGIISFESDNLIALDAGGFVDGLGVEAFPAEVDFCPGYKECRRLVDFVEACKIQISAIHDVDGPSLYDQIVQDIDIVDFARCYDDHGRNVAAQIQKGMEFYCPLSLPEFCPGEKRQAKVDGSRIQSVHRLIQLDAEGIFGVKLSGFCDKDLSEIGINPPIPVLIGMGKGIAGNLPPYAQVIKSGWSCPQTGLNISQAFSVGKLGEGHAEVLVPAGKADHIAVAVVSIDAFSELVCGDKVHQLCKDCFPGIHALPPFLSIQEIGTSEKKFSNRKITFYAINNYISLGCGIIKNQRWDSSDRKYLITQL